jgi:hypothetical protein
MRYHGLGSSCMQIDSDEVAAIHLAAEDHGSNGDRSMETDHEMALRLCHEEEAAIIACQSSSQGGADLHGEPRCRWHPSNTQNTPVSSDEELAKWIHMRERQMAAAEAAQHSDTHTKSDFELAQRLQRQETASAEAEASRRQTAAVGSTVERQNAAAGVLGRTRVALEQRRRPAASSTGFRRPEREKKPSESTCSVM